MIDEQFRQIGEGAYSVRCPTCEHNGHAPDGESDPIEYRTDERWRARMEARDHREWHPDHRPIARGPDGERVYG